MPHGYLNIATTPSVHAAQVAHGSAGVYERVGADRVFNRFGPDEQAFIASRDSFFMAAGSKSPKTAVCAPDGFVRPSSGRRGRTA
jgi:hypothetical protein